MRSTINLDQIIRKLDGQTPRLVAGEEVVVTIDLSTRRAIGRTFLTRFGGHYRDYLVTNNRNPARVGSGKLSLYSIRDAQHERTLSLDIDITICFCPEGVEGKVAEALCGEPSPAQIFAGMLERWVREFIAPGNEGSFIESYDAVRRSLETHLARRASAQTGLEIRPKVSLSAENAVSHELVIGPFEVGVRLQDYKQQQSLTIEAGLTLDERNYVKAYVIQEGRESPEELFKRHLKEYFDAHVTFEQFSHGLQHPNFKRPLLHVLSAALAQVGRRVSFVNFSTSAEKTTAPPREFVAVTYPYSHHIPGRAQPAVIHNTVQLYCDNSVAFLSSGVKDLEGLVKVTLNIILRRHLIGKTYVDLLLRFAPLEQSIKRELSERAAVIGYKVDHLVSLPTLREIDELTNPFDLSFDDTFETKLDKFEVQLKFNFKLCIPNLQTAEKYLNRDADVKEAIKSVVLSETRQVLRNIHPERFYLHFNHPDETAPNEAERTAVKELLNGRIEESLRREFGAEIFELTTRVGRTDLTERYNQLCFVIREFGVSIESADPQGTESLTLTGNFEVRGVYPDSKGWQQFSTMRLDLDGLQTQLQNHLKAELKTYHQSSFMFQNRIARRQVFAVVESYASQYMRREFGLMIHLTNFDRNTTEAERKQRQLLKELDEERRNANLDQGKLLVEKLRELRRRRITLLTVSPVEQEELQEVDKNIRLLQEELDAITSEHFGQHRLAAALESQLPDELPRAGEVNHASVQYELEAGPKGQLTE